MNTRTLAAVCQSRRQVSLAIFHNLNLEYTRSRTLASSTIQAEATIVGFLNWAFQQFEISAVALLTAIPDTRGSHLEALAETTALRFGIPVWRVTSDDLFHAFAYPPLRSRQQLREVVSGIWPEMVNPETLMMQDAVATGAFVQVERMFLAAREEATL